jgi:hypothetical protein
VATVNPEIGISGQHHWIRQDLREPHNAGIGNAHRHIMVFVQKLQDGSPLDRQQWNETQSPAAGGDPQRGFASGFQ